MTITIADGRGALWQWDTGRRCKITDGDGVKQVHYQNKCFGRSVDVDVGDDGTAIIPDELLQDWHTLTAYAYVTDDTGAYTMVQQDFAVHKRAKPAGYVYTPAEQMTLQTIQRQIGDLAGLTTEAKDTLVAAINEVARTGGGASSMDLRVAGGYIQYSTDSGSTWTNLIAVADLKGADGAQGNPGPQGPKGDPGDKGDPGAAGADGITPHIGDNGNWYLGTTDTGKPSRGATGAKGDTGATGPVGPQGPAGAPGKDGAGMDITGATVGQIAKITAVDESGVPTAWSPVDMPSGGGETWEKIVEIVIPEGADESTALTINQDSDGNQFSLVKARLCAKFPKYTGATTIPDFSFAMLNGKMSGRITPLAYTSVYPKVSTSIITGVVYEIDVSGAQQIERAIRSGAGGWSDDTSREYTTYGAITNTDVTWHADTLWAKPITSIGGAGMLIYPGCRFVLYGVRA